MSIEGKVAIVTGAAQGIGFAIAQRLGRDGAAIGIADVNADKAMVAAENLGESGIKASSVNMDVTNKKSIKDGIEKLEADLGVPTILVNNAGVYKSTPILDVSLDAWNACIDVMLTGSLLVSQSVAPHMINAKWGRIVNLGSIASQIGFGEDLGYVAAKTGMLGLTRSLAAELSTHNICVNTVCPGNILTGMLEETGLAIDKRAGSEPGTWLETRGNDIPLGRLGRPEDIAKAVSFLCSEDADYVTGQSLHVNGGLYQY